MPASNLLDNDKASIAIRGDGDCAGDEFGTDSVLHGIFPPNKKAVGEGMASVRTLLSLEMYGTLDGCQKPPFDSVSRNRHVCGPYDIRKLLSVRNR